MRKPTHLPVPHAINAVQDDGRAPAHLVESLKRAKEDLRLGRTVDATTFLDDLDRRIAECKLRAGATAPPRARRSAAGA